MARPDKAEKHLAQVRSALAAALSRGHLAEAIDALLALPAGERAPLFESVAKGLSAELMRVCERQDHSVSLTWLARFEKEPRLLDRLGEQDSQIRWFLFSTALRAKQWSRAQRGLQALRPQLEQAPFFAALDALVMSSGEVEPSVLLPFLSKDDERLGHEVERPRATYLPPTHKEHVDRACLQCFGAETWPRFREVTTTWLHSAPASVHAELRRVAVLLSQRELLVRSKGKDRSALEVARYCAEFAAVDAPAELEPVVLRCLGIAARVAEAPIEERATAESVTTILAAALAYPALSDVVEPVVLSVRFHGAATRVTDTLLQTVLKRRPTRVMVLYGAHAFAARDGQEPARNQAPVWFRTAFEHILKEPVLLARDLAAAGLEVARVVADLARTLPIDLTVRLIDELWPHADEAVREALAAHAGCDLLDKLRATAPVPKGGVTPAQVRRAISALDPRMGSLPDAVLKQFMSSPMGKLMLRDLDLGGALSGPIPKPMLRHWDSVSERITPYRVELLEAALELAPNSGAAGVLVDRFLARRTTLLSRLHTIVQALELGLVRSVPALQQRLFADLVPGATDAARALSFATDTGAPPAVCREIARCLFAALESDPAQSAAPEVKAVLRQATRLVAKKKATKRKAPAKKRAPAKKTATKRAKLPPALGDLFEEDPF